MTLKELNEKVQKISNDILGELVPISVNAHILFHPHCDQYDTEYSCQVICDPVISSYNYKQQYSSSTEECLEAITELLKRRMNKEVKELEDIEI